MKEKLKRLFSLFSVLLLVASITTAGALMLAPPRATATWDGTVASSFASGTGTASNPYLIKTEAQLGYFLSQINNEVTYEGLHIRLANDLDMTGATWENTSGCYFKGTLDGYGHTITADCSFLYGLGQSGTIKRLIYVAASDVSDAPLVSYNSGLIESCVVYGNVPSGSGSIAGIIADTSSGTIRSCGAIGYVHVYDKEGSDAGMIGRFEGGTIENCYSAVNASASGGGKYSLSDDGPLYGYKSSASATISGCYYDKNVYTYSCSQGAALTTEEMTDASFAEVMNQNAAAGCLWIQSSTDSVLAGYPIPTVCYDATTSLTYTDQNKTTYHSETLTTQLTATGSGTIYYTLDGSNPITSSTRKKYTGSITLSGDVTVRSVVTYNGEYSAVRTQTLIQLLGSGTESSPYLIYTKAQLDAVRLDLTACYRMMADLTYTDSDFTATGVASGGWNPIGTYETQFEGVFDGNGHAIFNLKGSNGGLFRYNKGTIKNLRMVDHLLYADGTHGAIANQSSGTISRCYAKSAFTMSTLPHPATSVGSVYVGGIVGSGDAEYCRNDGLVYATSTHRYHWLYAGGITGMGDAQSCYNTGKIVVISNTTTEYAFAGGITAIGTARDCRNDGSFYMNTALDYNQYLGGIGAHFSSSDAYRCVAAPLDYTLSANTSSRTSKASFAHSFSQHCYTLNELPDVTLYPELDMKNVWMMTPNGPIPQGIMQADGSCPVLYRYTAPSCTKEGLVEYDDDMGGPYSSERIPALGHNFGDWEPVKDSDLHIHTCSRGGCGEYEIVAHSWTAANTVAPTCTADGYTDYTCVCTAAKTVVDEGSATGHSYSDWEYTIVPDYLTGGERTHSCACGAEEIETVPATGQAAAAAVQAIYLKDSSLLVVSNVPEGLTVLVAGYKDGCMVFLDMRYQPDTSFSVSLSGVDADRVEIFFLYTAWTAIGDSLSVEL